MAGAHDQDHEPARWPEPKKRDDAIRRWARWSERRRLDLPSADWNDDDPDNPPPPKPKGLSLNLFFSLDGVRPDEFYVQRAMRWSQVAADQDAYHEAMRDVRDEAKGFHTLATSDAGRVG